MCRHRVDSREMQNEVPRLPIVSSDEQKQSSRNKELKKTRSDSVCKNINHTQCKCTKLLHQSNRKQLKPIGGPNRTTLRTHAPPQPTRMTNTSTGIGQRVLSAKLLRVKDLQNQLTETHYQLHELANENKLLKAIQKRQDSALKRYEGTNAELPRIINSHHEEIKVLNIKYRELKAQHRYTCDLLKEKEIEIHALQGKNQRLQRLNKDQHLEEREKLKVQVSDLSHQIEQQHESVQILNRKLTLESKRLKHQINCETTKHKETKKKLQETLEKLKHAEVQLAQKEKQLYNGHLPRFNKRKNITSQSLTNLQDNSLTSRLTKPFNNSKFYQSDLMKNSLPKLTGNDAEDSKLIPSKPNSSEISRRSETMASLEQIRNFRLPKSANSRRSSVSGRSSYERVQDIEDKQNVQTINYAVKPSRSRSFHGLSNDSDDSGGPVSEEDEEIKNITKGLEKKTISNKYHIPDELRKEAGYLSSDNSDVEGNKDEEMITPTSRSRNLHARLINGYIKSPIPTEDNDKFAATKPKLEEIKNHTSKLNRKKHHGSTKINLNTVTINDNDNVNINGSDNDNINHNDINNKVSFGEAEEINKDIQVSNEPRTDDFNQKNLEHDISFNDVENSKERKELLPSLIKSRTLQNKQEREKSDEYFKLEEIYLRKKSSIDDTSKMSDDDDILQYFDENNFIETGRRELESKETGFESLLDLDKYQSMNSLNSVCNGDVKADDNASNGANVKKRRNSNTKSARSVNIRSPEDKNQGKNGSPIKQESTDKAEKVSDKKLTQFNKQKLLAAMKAIDDNENIDLIPKKKAIETQISVKIQSQVTENLYRGLPTHTKKRDDIIKDIFGPPKVETKLQSSCSKLH